MSTPSNLWGELAGSKKFREQFNALQLKRGVAFQIRALLKKRGWTQEQLAEHAKLTQGVVSRAQNPGYGNLTVNTIARVAAGFDVAFIGQFVPFSELEEWFESLSEESGQIEPFEEEDRRLNRERVRVVRSRRRRRKGKLTIARKIAAANPLRLGQNSGAGGSQLLLFPTKVDSEPTVVKLFQIPQQRASALQINQNALEKGVAYGG